MRRLAIGVVIALVLVPMLVLAGQPDAAIIVFLATLVAIVFEAHDHRRVRR